MNMTLRINPYTPGAGMVPRYLAGREQLLEDKRVEVERNATEVFRAITNAPKKYKGIKITKDYSLLLELCNGETYRIEPGRVLNPSTGQSKVISLSYISGLNKSSNFALHSFLFAQKEPHTVLYFSAPH